MATHKAETSATRLTKGLLYSIQFGGEVCVAAANPGPYQGYPGQTVPYPAGA
jgi:hypothetical protein